MFENAVVVGDIIVTVPERGEKVVYVGWGLSRVMVINGFAVPERSLETLLIVSVYILTNVVGVRRRLSSSSLWSWYLR